MTSTPRDKGWINVSRPNRELTDKEIRKAVRRKRAKNRIQAKG